MACPCSGSMHRQRMHAPGRHPRVPGPCPTTPPHGTRSDPEVQSGPIPRSERPTPLHPTCSASHRFEPGGCFALVVTPKSRVLTLRAPRSQRSRRGGSHPQPLRRSIGRQRKESTCDCMSGPAGPSAHRLVMRRFQEEGVAMRRPLPLASTSGSVSGGSASVCRLYAISLPFRPAPADLGHHRASMAARRKDL